MASLGRCRWLAPSHPVLIALILLGLTAASAPIRARRIIYAPSMPTEAGDCAPGIITTLAGNGRDGYSSDGGPAIRASLHRPQSVALAPDGSIYIADTGNNRIRKVDSTGIITTVAGDGWMDRRRNIKGRFQGDGGPAIIASLCRPRGVAFGPDGSLYIADTDNNRIRRVQPSGIIMTVAGTGMEGRSGDGGLATRAYLNGPEAVAVGPDGSLYIADTCNHRVRKVDPTGIITTVAGDGTEGYWGDQGPAIEASLNFPRGLVVADGALYIADCGNNRVRKVGPNHIITTVAGNGQINYGGDGGPATETSLFRPRGLALGPDGSIYVADTWNNRIRKVAPNGVITTVAGNGRDRYWGDGRPAVMASLHNPRSLAVGPDGSLYIADTDNNRVRKVCGGEPLPPPPTITIPL